ncbi:MAG: GspE/PulE family protein [Zoogloeaceae bacterium]|jgi:general secretion pathway protein E|nr:GspE/PulE family protein [Zoogloeaceae bacterium]
MNAPTAQPEHRLTLNEVLGWLVADGLADQTAADTLLTEQRMQNKRGHPLTVIAAAGWDNPKAPGQILTAEVLTQWLAGRVGLEYRHLDPLKIDFSGVADVVSSTYAERFSILPIGMDAAEIQVATSEPFLLEWEKDLSRLQKKRIRRVFANPADVTRYLAEFFNLAKSVKRAAAAGSQQSALSSFEQLVELGKSDRQLDANDQHVVTIVDWLWQYAFDQRASDIHIEPRREAGIVRFRIDGVLHQVYRVPPGVLSAMTSRIKLLGRMDVIEKRRPQDGRVKTRMPNGMEVELRLSTLPTAFGEKLVMRIFDPGVLMRDFSQLGFSADDVARWRGMTARPNGIILVTGPTGSGKTTTLYSTLKHLATPEVNVCTIEDPIEMIEPAFNQVQVQQAVDMSFAEGVRALMRQDPDIIMIGEIRDQETVQMAIQAALTGHLVLSTLHTNDAPSAITRMQDLGAASYLINATLLGVMAQRLVRTLCPKCKAARPATEVEKTLWANLVSPWMADSPASFWHPVGCLDCRMTGFSGRVGIYEVLLMNEKIRQLVNEAVDLRLIRETASRDGMKALRISGAMKAAQGLTSLEEVIRVAPPPEDVRIRKDEGAGN